VTAFGEVKAGDDVELRFDGAACAPPHAHDVEVHAGAADVLADLAQHDEVERFERNAGQILPGQLQQVGLGVLDGGGGEDGDGRRLVEAVFDDGDAGDYGQLGDDDSCGVGDSASDAPTVERCRAAFLAEADGQHFEEAAFPATAEGGVGLDTVDDQDGIRLGGVGVEVDGHALLGHADLDHVHAAADGGSRAQAVALQHGALAFGCAAAVAAHGGDEEWLPAAGANLLKDGRNDLTDATDAAAAQADGDLHAGPDGGGQGQATQAGAYVSGDVGDMVAGELLADWGDLGQGHAVLSRR